MTQHYFTVDVEEHFQVSAFEPHVAREAWDRLESRVAANIERLLALLGDFNTRGTFFVLGWIADRHPDVVRAIAGAGHEIASHGWGHRRLGDLTPETFRQSVRRSKDLLEDITGVSVLGYRAPSFSIVPGREWAFDVLIEEGYRYDSSLFPIRRPGYGYPSAGRAPHTIRRPGGTLDEYPPATLRIAGVNLPAAGGAYLRIFPLAVVRKAFTAFDRRGIPATLYVHPWEVDPEQPRVPVSWTAGARHYTGLDRTLPRLRRLLEEFRFTAVADRYAPEPEPAGS